MKGEKKSQKKPSKYFCNLCDYNTMSKRDFNNHNLTLKHKTRDNGEEWRRKVAENPPHIFLCEICSYKTYKICDYNKHLGTTKHLINDQKHQTGINSNKNHCIYCNKVYSSQSNLWKHSQKCNIREPDKNIIENTMVFSQVLTPELFFEFFKQSKDLQNLLVEQNKELLSQNELHQKQMFELAQKHSVNNSHNTTTNNNNTNFNLQFFLNETCKDAMNITDFVNSLQLTTKDFENTGRLGYVEGISRIIINEMKDIDVEKRPIHCTDLKRETIYIKHDNMWEKEEPGKKKLKWAVDSVARLNLQQIDKWQDENPEYKIGESTKNFEYLKYFSAALGGQHKEEHEKFSEKIMRNVLKEVTIDKSM
jgi:hypothetical protein